MSEIIEEEKLQSPSATEHSDCGGIVVVIVVVVSSVVGFSVVLLGIPPSGIGGTNEKWGTFKDEKEEGGKSGKAGGDEKDEKEHGKRDGATDVEIDDELDGIDELEKEAEVEAEEEEAEEEEEEEDTIVEGKIVEMFPKVSCFLKMCFLIDVVWEAE